MRTEQSPTWLCPAVADRERLLDMDRRLKPLRAAAMAALAIALLAMGPWVGWWTLIPLAMAGAFFSLMERDLEEAARPEYRIAAAWVFCQLAIASSIVLTGGPDSPAVAWLAIPLVTLPARFTSRGVAAGVALTASLMMLTTAAVDPVAIGDMPERLAFPLALLIAVAILSTALMESDVEHRSEAVIDPLTGMLNRNALMTRVAELTQQAEVNGEPVALVVGDLDRFKAVNDGHGHQTGDAVLQEIAYRLRKQLRAYDLAYRLGGEEFLVVLPGGDAPAGEELAERLRRTVADQPAAGLMVTMSFGVSASEPGRFDYEAVFAAADIALYEAKRGGRDQVRVRGLGDSVPASIPAPAPPAAPAPVAAGA